jgi:hypothetical protein
MIVGALMKVALTLAGAAACAAGIYAVAGLALQRPDFAFVDAALASRLGVDYQADPPRAQALPPLDAGIIANAAGDRARDAAPGDPQQLAPPPASQRPAVAATADAPPPATPAPATRTPRPEPTATTEVEPTPVDTPEPEPTKTATPEPKPTETKEPTKEPTRTPRPQPTRPSLCDLIDGDDLDLIPYRCSPTPGPTATPTPKKKFEIDPVLDF